MSQSNLKFLRLSNFV